MESLKKAVFTTDTFEIELVTAFTDMHPDWANLTTLDDALPEVPEPGWLWHDDDLVVTGASRGGNLEILHWNLAADRWIRPVEDYSGCVLLLETSEEMPSAVDVYRMLRNMGERGLLKQFPRSSSPSPRHGTEWSTSQSRCEQSSELPSTPPSIARSASITPARSSSAVRTSGTDTQRVLPYGGQITVDGPGRRITVAY